MTEQELQQRSYVPYSNTAETVVVESTSGACYPGVRIENISFPLTITAILCGLVSCLSEGEKPAVIYLPESLKSMPKLDYWVNELDLRKKPISAFKGQLASPLSDDPRDIPDRLEELLERAVTPHSDFPVSALLETNKGLVSGVNVEFSAWETGLCAERTAIAKALAFGIEQANIKAMHLHTRYGDYSSPCGACRQVIVEHMPNIPVFLYHPDGSVSRHFSSDLLPYSFTSDFLKRNN